MLTTFLEHPVVCAMFTSFSFVFKMRYIAGDFYKNVRIVISTSVVLAGTLTWG